MMNRKVDRKKEQTKKRKDQERKANYYMYPYSNFPSFLLHFFPSFRWRGGKSEDGEEVLVNIESPSSNVRRISSSIVINRPLQDVWRILTDYDK